jgi:hypothetical protein
MIVNCARCVRKLSRPPLMFLERDEKIREGRSLIGFQRSYRILQNTKVIDINMRKMKLLKAQKYMGRNTFRFLPYVYFA